LREVFIKNHSIKVALFLVIAFLQISVYANQVSQLDARLDEYYFLKLPTQNKKGTRVKLMSHKLNICDLKISDRIIMEQKHS